tara:strand:+ start:2931 stop:3323 length:393 start_codon:yes stop_codon:yes gene_type:complete
MANPNIVNLSSITGNTTYYTPSGTTAVVLLTNASSSNTVYKINNIVAANVTGSAVAATVSIYTNGSVAQGSAPSGGTAYPIIYQVSVPANAAAVVVDKSTTFYLQEGTCISITSGTSSAITYTVSYEVLS